MLELAPPDLEGVRGVGELDRAVAQERRQVLRRRIERFTRSCRDRQQLPRPGRTGRLARRRLLEYGMGVGAACAQRTDSRMMFSAASIFAKSTVMPLAISGTSQCALLDTSMIGMPSACAAAVYAAIR